MYGLKVEWEEEGCWDKDDFLNEDVEEGCGVVYVFE